MSSILIAGLFILFIALIVVVLVSINNNHRKKTARELIDHFNEFGERHYLTFTRKEKMENFIIGLDESYKKLFVLRKAGNQYDSQVIELKEVKSCSNKKLYKSINMGTVKRERYETHFDKIVLQFDYFDARDPVQIIFYEQGRDHLTDMADLERKAESWVAILTQTLNIKLKSTA